MPRRPRCSPFEVLLPISRGNHGSSDSVPPEERGSITKFEERARLDTIIGRGRQVYPRPACPACPTFAHTLPKPCLVTPRSTSDGPRRLRLDPQPSALHALPHPGIETFLSFFLQLCVPNLVCQLTIPLVQTGYGSFPRGHAVGLEHQASNGTASHSQSLPSPTCMR